jgi:hypothetical protein
MEAAKQSRKGAKGWLTRAEKKLREINMDDDADVNIIQAGIDEFKLRLKKYTDTQTTYEQHCATDEELYEAIEEVGHYLDKVTDTLIGKYFGTNL